MDKIKLQISEFARCLSVQTAYIQMNIKRRKIILTDDRLIDLQNPVNNFFLESQINKGKKFDLGNIYNNNGTKIKPPKIREIKIDIPDKGKELEIKKADPIEVKIKQVKEISKHEKIVTGLAERELQLKVQKLEIDNDIKLLQKAKIEGSLVPVDAMKNVFLWSIDTFHNSYLQQVNNIANVYVQILGADSSKFSAIIKELSQVLTRIKEDAKTDLLSGIDGIVEEYQEVRGRGERK